MENASKALLIAGAILLAILLISLGIMVYNNAKGTVSDANIDSETVQAFNTKITQYCGSDKSGSTMNNLMDVLSSLNGAQNGKANQHHISFEVTCSNGGAYFQISGKLTESTDKKSGPDFTEGTNKQYPYFNDSHRYTATYETDTNGYINKVIISN